MDQLATLLRPIEIAVAWIMVGFHQALTVIGMPAASGWTWALSIVGLVVVIRIILIPLFVKQIKASRGLQLIQPEMRKIQAKYKGRTDPESRQKMSQETMALYKSSGTNPFASCLPILMQSPIFFALFRVLNGIPKHQVIGPLNERLVTQADDATLFGAPLSGTFLNTQDAATKIVTVVLIILMSATTFTTQRQLMTKNMPADALNNPMAQQQKMIMYVLPVVFAVSGVNFPIGVLLYWLTTNIWSMGQQFYVIRRMPTPGSLAAARLEERRRRKGQGAPSSSEAGGVGGVGAPPTSGVNPGSRGAGAKDGAHGGPGNGGTANQPVRGQRQQPRRQPRQQRRGTNPASGPTGPDTDKPREVG